MQNKYQTLMAATTAMRPWVQDALMAMAEAQMTAVKHVWEQTRKETDPAHAAHDKVCAALNMASEASEAARRAVSDPKRALDLALLADRAILEAAVACEA